MAKKDRLSGNEAVAVAMRQVNPDVMLQRTPAPALMIRQAHPGRFSNVDPAI